MPVLSVQNLSAGFAGRVLFACAAFDIDEKDAVGLVGANASGKTTLFRLLAGELEPLEGAVALARGAKIGYMRQQEGADSYRTLYEEALTVFDRLVEIERELDAVASQIAGTGATPERIERQHELSEEYQRGGGLTFRSRTASALAGLGFSAAEQQLSVSKLSGGQLSKLGLCKLLLSGADLLLLDEPTNHLDFESSGWLEGFLRDYPGAFIAVSHDRYFLDKITSKTIEIEHGRVTLWQGGYSRFAKLKSEKEAEKLRRWNNRKDEIKRIEGIIEQQRRWGRERNYITAASKEKMLAKKKAELETPDSALKTLDFSFRIRTPGPNEVLDVRCVAKSFGGRRLFENASFQIRKGERVFLLGPNGCGKTTLLRIVVARLRADAGSVLRGANTQTGYFDQSLGGFEGENTLLEELRNIFPAMTETQLRSALASFLFRGDDVFKSVRMLSGGEKARASLLKLMLKGPNFLVLDEPTNHLDIASREALERALAGYDGTLLAVSHDRYFINKLATRTLFLTPKGVESCDGGYDEYLEKSLAARAAETAKPAPKTGNEYFAKKERASRLRRLEGEIARCEDSVTGCESKVGEIGRMLSDPVKASDYEEVLRLTALLAETEKQRDELIARWEELHRQYENLCLEGAL